MAARTFTIQVNGLDCAEEVAILEREVGLIVGGKERLVFDILNGRMIVSPTSEGVTEAAVLTAVARTGMRGKTWQEGREPTTPQTFYRRNERTLLTSASGAFIAAGGAVSVAQAGWASLAEGGPPFTARVIYGLAILAGVWTVLPKAWASARRLRPDMNLLMVVAACGAVALGDGVEAATVAFLFSLSLALEAWSIGRARRAVAALMDLTPLTVRVLREGHEQIEPAEKVPVGTRFLVRPGERVPLDGMVVSGSSSVNQAPLTGESLTVPKQPGDSVFAGTVNGEGAIEVESTKPAGDTALAHVVKLVAEAHTKRAPVEQWVDRFARIYTPVVFLLAVLVALVPPLFSGECAAWVYRSLVLLVIACPCALVISTPVSIVASLACAARKGVLVKGGMFVELPAGLKAVAFDKTGTLTEGKPAVVEVVPLNGHDARESLERAAGMELRSEHPLAQAIVEHARGLGLDVQAAQDLWIVPGKGATGTWGGRTFWVGSSRLMEERGQSDDEVRKRIEVLASEGRTVVAVGNDRHVCGLIALADRPRGNAALAIRSLRQLGVGHVVMLTGDNEATAQAVARETGVDEVRANLLPADKLEVLRLLTEQYGSVAMVGDGVNDAPALAQATVGVAMGAAGTDAAIETADVALMSDDLTNLPWLMNHSRRTMAVVRQNVVFSLAVKGLFLVLAVSGFSPLWLAILADTGASLAVVANGLGLLRES
ncbi:MAG: heavy metal translocating P-type ATPase [Gemmataceae bacterium]